MKKSTHTQCEMQKGSMSMVAWIPSKFAVEGKYVKLLDEDGWQVMSTGHELDSDYVLEYKDDYHNYFPSLKK